MQREVKLGMLRAAMLLPLTDQEIGLLRTISHEYAMGNERHWGSANEHRAAEVEALFVKCSACLSP